MSRILADADQNLIRICSNAAYRGARAAEFDVSPQRIGVMGSSAGGQLVASASTQWDHRDGRTGAALDSSVSARLDFAVLVYRALSQ